MVLEVSFILYILLVVHPLITEEARSLAVVDGDQSFGYHPFSKCILVKLIF